MDKFVLTADLDTGGIRHGSIGITVVIGSGIQRVIKVKNSFISKQCVVYIEVELKLLKENILSENDALPGGNGILQVVQTIPGVHGKNQSLGCLPCIPCILLQVLQHGRNS